MKFGGVMHSTMNQMAIWNGHTQPFFARLMELLYFHDKLGPGLTLRILVTRLKFGGAMHSTMKQWPCFANFCAFHRTVQFSMIGLDQVWRMFTHFRKCEEVVSWPEILWHDAMYREADHYLKWPCLANVHIFWSRPTEGAVVLREPLA